MEQLTYDVHICRPACPSQPVKRLHRHILVVIQQRCMHTPASAKAQTGALHECSQTTQDLVQHLLYRSRLPAHRELTTAVVALWIDVLELQAI